MRWNTVAFAASDATQTGAKACQQLTGDILWLYDHPPDGEARLPRYDSRRSNRVPTRDACLDELCDFGLVCGKFYSMHVTEFACK